jgi:polyferredoxin
MSGHQSHTNAAAFRILPANRPAAPPAPQPAPRASLSRCLAALAILPAGAILPAVLAILLTSPPTTRNIHIEAYRYGFSPARIHANRGDRLHLTFSTRDTGQSLFFQDYDLHIGITPGDKLLAIQHISQPDAPPVYAPSVDIVAGRPGWLGFFVSKSQYRNHTYNGPLHGTERGDLIVAPNILLYSSLGLLLAIPLAGLLIGRRSLAPSRPIDLFRAIPRLKRLFKAPSFQFNLALPMLAVFWFIVLAGFFGTKVPGRNAGPMIVWVLWLSSLIIFLVPLGGRIWCTACPLPVFGEWLQRRRLARNPAEIEGRVTRRFLGIPLIWPKALSNAWPRTLFFLLLGTFSTTLVAMPPATSWMLIGLVALAALLAVFPDQRLFCRHVCPINSYISLYSTTGRVMVRTVAAQPCENCSERFCLTGSAKGWGCPYGLCIADVGRNNDCGACMECVKTCAYDNVSVFWRSDTWDREVADYSEAWQAIVMFALACLYCYINLGAWDRIRDWIDLVDKENWGSFTLYAIAVWIVSLALIPALWYLATRIGLAIGRSRAAVGPVFRSTSAAFIPIGLGIWIAFAISTVSSMMTFLLQSLSDPFNWGWNLLGMAGSRWHICFSSGLPWIQVTCVLIGVAVSLRTVADSWRTAVPQSRRPLLASLPLAASLWTSAAVMIGFFAA